MKKYDNNRLKFSVNDFMFVVVFLLVCIVSTYFSSQYFNTKGLFNIEKTSVDYIISAPSKAQIDEIKRLDFVENITPYVYRSTTSKKDGKNYKTNLFIVENTEDINKTVFSDELLINKDTSVSGNPLFVSNDYANNIGAKIGDTVEMIVSDNELEFTIAAIYKSDYRYVGGTVVTVMNSELSDCFENSFQYTGAYVGCKNISEMDTYLKTYVPLGDLRTRDEFNDDESYSIYLDERNKTDFTKLTFSTSQYLKELHTRNNPKLNRNMFFALISFILGIILCITGPFIKTNKYTRNEVKKDIRNNFTIEKETKMYFKYYMTNTIMFVVSCVISVLVEYIFFSKEVSLLAIGTELFLILLSSVISCSTSIKKLKSEFNNRIEEMKKEKRIIEGSESSETANN